MVEMKILPGDGKGSKGEEIHAENDSERILFLPPSRVELEDGGGKGDRSTMFADKGIKRILSRFSGHFHGTLNPWHHFK